MPQEVVFVRSDQYSFVLRGVPSIFIVPGFGSAPGVDGAALFREWLAILVASDVANSVDRPTWKPGDFFGTHFGGARG